MSTAQPSSVAPRLRVPLPDVASAEQAPDTARAREGTPAGLGGPGTASSSPLPWLPGTSALPTASWLVSSAASKGSGAGYAPAKGEWSFLSDPSLSVEEKLARFMMTAQKKLDDELTAKMSDYKAKYGEGGTETKKEDGGGFLGGILGAIFPAGGIFDSLFGGLEKMLGDALKSFGGPLLAALASAVGLPMLAPAAAKVGESLGSSLAGALQSGKSSGSASGSKSGSASAGKGGTSAKSTSGAKSGSTAQKGEAGSPDERLEMLEIQRLVEKQNQLFTLVSNLMKGMHDTTMVAVQNVR